MKSQYKKTGFLFALMGCSFFMALMLPVHGDSADAPTALKNDILAETGIFPSGFELEEPLQYYGTDNHKLQDGTIYNYMNGGGVVYLKYGFSTLVHASLKNTKNTRLTIDVFEFAEPGKTKSAYADEAICPPGFSNMEFNGFQAKAYFFSPEFFLYFIKNNRLVYIYVSNDEMAEPVKDLAARLFQKIR